MNEKIIEYNEEYNYNKVYCSEGHYLTFFNELTDDAINFSASKELYCPITVDLSYLLCIDDDKYNELKAKQVDAIIDKVRMESVDEKEFKQKLSLIIGDPEEMEKYPFELSGHTGYGILSGGTMSGYTEYETFSGSTITEVMSGSTNENTIW